MTGPRDGRVVWSVDGWRTVLANLIQILEPFVILTLLLPTTLAERKIRNTILAGYVL
jgi:hypothetical protein